MSVALYLAGIIDKDLGVCEHEAYKHIKKLKLLKKPKKNCIAIFGYKGFPGHMAFVTNTRPLRLLHRKSYTGPIEENITLKYLMEVYNYDKKDITYRIPKY